MFLRVRSRLRDAGIADPGLSRRDMLTVFFAATIAERDALVASGTLDPGRHGLPAVDAGGLSPIALVTLDAAVTGADAGAIRRDVLHEPLANRRR